MNKVGIHTCERGHPYRSSELPAGSRPTCPRCDRADLVALAYGDCQEPPRACRLLHFVTETLTSWEEVRELLQVVGNYNAFSPEAVARELKPLFPYLSGVDIGREGSPVLYARVPHWTHQAINWKGGSMGSPIPPETRKALGESFLAAMRRAGADETSDEGYVFRAWWD